MLKVEWTGTKGDFLGAVLFYNVDDDVVTFADPNSGRGKKPIADCTLSG